MSDNKITVNIIGDTKKFPDENGNRVKVQISSKSINNFQNILDNFENIDKKLGVFTCIDKTNKTYSLSIRIEKGITIEPFIAKPFSIKTPIIDNEFIYIIPSTESEEGSFIKNTENAEVKYILIIGKCEQETMSNLTTIELDITKVFYILNNKPVVKAFDNEEKVKIATITNYEFLNLYYINYFSFDADYFNVLYNSLKDSEKSTSVVSTLDSTDTETRTGTARVAAPGAASVAASVADADPTRTRARVAGTKTSIKIRSGDAAVSAAEAGTGAEAVDARGEAPTLAFGAFSAPGADPAAANGGSKLVKKKKKKVN
jgi:hypothetical protein